MPGFEPLVDHQPECLILGSMPSVISLNEHRYYANPHNAFWWIVAELLGLKPDLNYQQRCQGLTQSGFALWDVLYDCERRGSADSAIVRNTEKVNDFESFFAKHPTLKLLAFNGAAAERIFMQHCSGLLNSHNYLATVRLPSTSPAYAAMSRANKLQAWRAALFRFLPSPLVT